MAPGLAFEELELLLAAWSRLSAPPEPTPALVCTAANIWPVSSSSRPLCDPVDHGGRLGEARTVREPEESVSGFDPGGLT